MNSVTGQILRFVLLVLAQVLIVNNIRLGGYANPFVYVLFIILLPFTTPRWLLLVLGFLLGLAIDWFMSTPGLHAGATVFMAFMRPSVIRLVSGPRQPEPDESPTIASKGKRWFYTYTALLVFAHHLALFFLEVFSFSQFADTIIRTLLSSMFSIVLVLVLVSLFSKVSK